jgi:peptide/nickel transport system permease protein
MAIAIPRRERWYAVPSLLRFLSAVRRLPLIPLVALIIVLVIPAIFADIIAPHDPLGANLSGRLIPPFWASEKVVEKAVVEGEAADPRTQISQKELQLEIDLGNVTLPEGSEQIVVKTVVAAFPDDFETQIAFTTVLAKLGKGEIVVPPGLSDDAYLAIVETGLDTWSRAAEGLKPDEVQVQVRERVLPETVDVTLRPGGSMTHVLGTDKQGRDVLSRIIHGSRVSIVVAGVAILIGGVIGTVLGIVSGYYGGWIDAVIMRLVDISLSIPIILLALVLVAAVGPSKTVVVTVLVVLLWSRYARMTRGETLAVRVQDFISRARVAGASDVRIMIHHIFPNVINSLIVLATLQVGFVIVLESVLSFLGAGIPKPTPAWGLMVAEGRELIIEAWWVAFFPGLAITLVVLSMNLLGDWLRDRLDPKQRQV